MLDVPCATGSTVQSRRCRHRQTYANRGRTVRRAGALATQPVRASRSEREHALDPTPSARRRTRRPVGLSALRSILRIRPFRRLWLVLGVASLGDWLGLLATSIFAAAAGHRRRPRRALAFGGVIAVRLLPALLLGPIAGVLADRFDRRLPWSSAT